MLRILKPKRRAFTLVELLVVIGIIVVLASLAVLILDSTSNHRAASRAADQLQGWLAQGKTLALRDQLPRGIRLVRQNESSTVYATGVQFIEQPDNYVPFSPATGAIATLTVNAASPTVASVNMDITGDVSVNDMLDLTTGTESAHRILGLSFNSGSTTITLASSIGSAAGCTTLPFTLSSGYRFIRMPRPLLGEPMMELPKGTVVLLAATAAQPYPSINLPVSYEYDPITGLPYVDIIFSNSGQVIGATGGRIVLWVTDTNGPNGTNAGEPTLLTIYARTGHIASQLQYLGGNPPNPYYYTQDGLSSGL